jgi:hypothetical protein
MPSRPTEMAAASSVPSSFLLAAEMKILATVSGVVFVNLSQDRHSYAHLSAVKPPIHFTAVAQHFRVGVLPQGSPEIHHWRSQPAGILVLTNDTLLVSKQHDHCFAARKIDLISAQGNRGWGL